MRIIGADQSSTGTGVSFFVNGKLKDYKLIKPKSSKRTDEIYTDAMDVSNSMLVTMSHTPGWSVIVANEVQVLAGTDTVLLSLTIVPISVKF